VVARIVSSTRDIRDSAHYQIVNTIAAPLDANYLSVQTAYAGWIQLKLRFYKWCLIPPFGGSNPGCPANNS
jgi:hypothetical protein